MTKVKVRTPPLAIELQPSAVDMVPLGIVKCDRSGMFTYANRALLQIAGVDDWRGLGVHDVFRRSSLAKVRRALASRFEQHSGSEYEVVLTRQDGTTVPVSITGFPETNAKGTVIGTAALVRDLTVETVQRKILEAVQREGESGAILEVIANELQHLVPYDRLDVILVNQDRTYLRSIFSRSEGTDDPPRNFRWWRIPKAVAPLLRSKDTLLIPDLAKWYAASPARRGLLRDPAVKDFLARGFVSCLSYPIFRQGHRVASVGLYRKEGKPFTSQDKRIVNALPLADAVGMALRHESEGTLHFLVELMQHIATAYDSPREVAQTIVNKIFKHYGWDYVSIFQVYEHCGEIRLVAQQAKDEHLLAPRDSKLRIDEGVLGYVFRTKIPVNIGDLPRSSEFKKIYVRRANIVTRSELCVPIGAKGHWILNIEDRRQNAFVESEKKDLQTIATELSALLDRSVEYRYRSAIFSRANDAIIMTDNGGTIVEVNDATSVLLRQPKADFVGRRIDAFIADAQIARSIVDEPSFANHPVVLRRHSADRTHAARTARGGQDATAASDDTSVRVLLSAAALPDDVGGRVYVATDMTLLARVEQLEFAQGVYREVTAQIKTPMSLAIAWLRRHAAKAGADDLPIKVLQQLQKVELTLDRMMLFERGEQDDIRHEVPLQIDSLVKGVLQEIPATERRYINEDVRGGETVVRADPYELRYSLMTMLSYLLRVVPETGVVELSTRAHDSEVEITVEGQSPHGDGGNGYAAACRYSQAMSEISFGRDTLRALIERNRGRFRVSELEHADRVAFRMEFPAMALAEDIL